MIIAYARVSKEEQELACQLDALKKIATTNWLWQLANAINGNVGYE